MDDREKLIELLKASPSLDALDDDGYAMGADHLIANGVTIGGSDLIAEVITDRIICDQEGKYHHQFRFKLGDRDLGISKELPEELVALAMMEQQWIPVTEPEPPKEVE